jgi:hypothetical protein
MTGMVLSCLFLTWNQPVKLANIGPADLKTAKAAPGGAAFDAAEEQSSHG